ncbi:hypothetical protein [Massilia sp. BSC265]|uniref:hypothetical protein n=1 Tax=Massilia sp. BSC265 TaxID=1549812 RepID=UPI0004E86A16|nr:hypothetical protein [Massilia sp. BSC265]KFI08324.1 hypothetical protein JN27_05875 [Massilia sp. BSC265]
MITPYWYLPLEVCVTLDDIRAQWRALLELHGMGPSYEPPRYSDAMLAFVGACRLPARLRLAAVLALGSSFDFDLRLALGALDEEIMLDEAPWPDSVVAAVLDNGCALRVESADPWLAAFVAGRLAGVRGTMSHDGTRLENWRAAFWSAFLRMACRHAWIEGVALALRQGADPGADGHEALAITARGAHAHGIDTSAEWAPQLANRDFQRILLQLLDGGIAVDRLAAVALPAAASVDNTAMLDFLLAHGALGVQVQAGRDRALAVAARSMAFGAFAWLLAHGADIHADGEAVLAAAVETLDETMVETVLAAGADLRAGAARAYRAAQEAKPYDLYSAEADLEEKRAGMAVFLRRIARDGQLLSPAGPSA